MDLWLCFYILTGFHGLHVIMALYLYSPIVRLTKIIYYLKSFWLESARGIGIL